MASKTVYRCKQGLACSVDGQRYHFSGGDLVLEDHPVRPENNPNFEEVSSYVERISQPRRRGVLIEEATAEPGVPRSVSSVRKRRGRKAAKSAERQTRNRG